MAESQVPYIYNDSESDIIINLSEARFSPYLKSAGFNKHYAFNLYLYNARLSKAFLYPLHILEVTLRNRINEIFSITFDNEWYKDQSFRSGLSSESLDALDRGIHRAKRPNKEDIVATLTFDFWSNLFRPEYDRFVWQTNMKKLLPNNTLTRKEFEKVVRKINEFRNRIAHYEPIHKINLSEMHVMIIDTLSWLSNDISLWVKHYSTVNECLRMKPSIKGDSHPFVGERCDNNFQILHFDKCISKIQDSNFTICIDSQDKINAIINHQHLANYLMSYIEDEELLIDLKNHEINHLITKLNLNNNMYLCDYHEPYSSIKKYFKGKIKFLVILNNDELCGIIEKSHRRY
jgi:hypothetical protein